MSRVGQSARRVVCLCPLALLPSPHWLRTQPAGSGGEAVFSVQVMSSKQKFWIPLLAILWLGYTGALLAWHAETLPFMGLCITR